MNFYLIGYWGRIESESAVGGLSISRMSVDAGMQVKCCKMTHVYHSVPRQEVTVARKTFERNAIQDS